MAVYPAAHMANFMRLVRAANPGFNRPRSSLDGLIGVLESAAGTGTQVCNAVAGLPIAKTKRYIDALYYLLSTYAGLPANPAANMNLGTLNETEAVLYTQTPMPATFQPSGPQATRVFCTPPNAAQGMTLEQFLIDNRANTGLILIHLSGVVNGMNNKIFNDRSCLTHMTSVLKVARLCNVGLCVLTMDNTSDVCVPMRAEYNQYPASTRVYEPHHHMGSIDANFTNFATGNTNCVVMGFDAGICVFANVFGADERMGAGPAFPYRAPISTLTNVVMSRAGLVTANTVTTVASPTMGQAEYGPIWNT